MSRYLNEVSFKVVHILGNYLVYVNMGSTYSRRFTSEYDFWEICTGVQLRYLDFSLIYETRKTLSDPSPTILALI